MEINLANRQKVAVIVTEESAYPGVVRVAGKLADDFERAGMEKGIVHTLDLQKNSEDIDTAIIAGTLGKSAFLDDTEKNGLADWSAVRGKREVYAIKLVENPCPGVRKACIVAGSDKRGTIYGIFAISELLGVSPWYDWANVPTAKKEQLVLTEADEKVSKEPSVKYRGFFINDEWPAFGNWTTEKFGGFTAEMYDKVFELLLRLKGNYLWPAMWSSSFSLDGPGLDSAILADEYGVVMCNSHHEPCLRHSEEWDKVKGKDTKYGDKWNYYSNKEGLLAYWEEGLIRNGSLENVITIGMRGERDSTVEGPQTLEDNIEMLKDIITNQRRLIAKHVNADTSKVPQMLALYKEVEAYFYGDKETKGLIDWEGLDGVTCMLCEDNFGYMRTLPMERLRDRDGGWGMYYHFDYHGGPISYEWLNSTYLTKVWEQMSMAYDYGIRDIWVVNVGDLKFQEYPLDYFMNLAYDFERYGTKARNRVNEFTADYAARMFGNWFDKEDVERIASILTEYTRILHNRKPEAMNENVYHPVHFGESDRLLEKIEFLMSEVEALFVKAGKEVKDCVFETLYFQVTATLNIIKMQLLAGKNHFYAERGAVLANEYAAMVDECIRMDQDLIAQLNNIHNGKWNHMADSMHVGFRNWNDEDSRYPVKMYVEPVNRPRIIVSEADSEEYSTGGDWTGKTIRLEAFEHRKKERAFLHICNGGSRPLHCEVVCTESGVTFSENRFEVEREYRLEVILNREAAPEEIHFRICSDGGNVRVVAAVQKQPVLAEAASAVIIEAGYASVEAENYSDRYGKENGSFHRIEGYGRTLSGMKVYPTTVSFRNGKDSFLWNEAPYLEYSFFSEEEAEYTISLYHSPASPVFHEEEPVLYYGIKVNDGSIAAVNTIHGDYVAGEPSCEEWCRGVLNQIRITRTDCLFHKGVNRVRIYAADPGVVLEKIEAIKKGIERKASYLGC